MKRLKLMILMFSPQIERDDLIEKLEKHKKISDWFFVFPSSVFIKSSETPRDLIEFLDAHYGKKVCFINVVNNEFFGALPSQYWVHFQHSKYHSKNEL